LFWRTGSPPDRSLVASTADVVKRLLSAVGLGAAGVVGVLLATDIHDAIIKAEAQADQVIECVVRDMDAEASDMVQPGTAKPGTIGASTTVFTPRVGTAEVLAGGRSPAEARTRVIEPAVENEIAMPMATEEHPGYSADNPSYEAGTPE
jgi:hypothetical protein